MADRLLRVAWWLAVMGCLWIIARAIVRSYPGW